MAVITSEQAKIIASLERKDGCLQLARLLKWEYMEDEDDSQAAILIDNLYDHLMFAIQKGFPWEQVCRVFQISYGMIQECKGKSITDAVILFRNKCESYRNIVSQQYLTQYIEFFFQTFMMHYKLYQYVMLNEQEKCTQKCSVHIETLHDAAPFNEAKELHIWDYEDKVRRITEEEQKRNSEREEERSRIVEQDALLLEQTYAEMEKTEVPLDRQHLLDLVDEVTKAHITAATHSIESTIQASLDDLTFKLEKTCIPRPSELGPPPKISTKTPNTGKQQRQDNSRMKSGMSRTSSRTSKPGK